MSRFLSLVLCLVCAPAFAETITGTYGTLYLDGGTYTVDEPAHINWLRAANNADVTVNGGTIGQFELFTQTISIHGGNTIGAGAKFFAWEGTEINLHVLDITPESLEAIDRLMAYEGRFGSVNMILESGDRMALGLGTPVDGARPRWNVIYAGDSLLDVGLDGMMGIGELNNVRNTFGSDAATGDFDLDGEVDIMDLNLVRNHFGSAYFPDRAGASAVPEPSTLAMALAFSGLSLAAIARRRCLVQHHSIRQ